MIRPAKETDAPAMAEVMSDWIDASPWMPRLHTRADDFGFCQRLITRMQVLIADRPDGIGFLASDGRSIDALYLAPEIQRAGWGTALLDAVKHRQPKLTLWVFQANKGAVAFYQSQGFMITDVTDGQGNAEKLPDYFMTWENAA